MRVSAVSLLCKHVSVKMLINGYIFTINVIIFYEVVQFDFTYMCGDFYLHEFCKAYSK